MWGALQGRSLPRLAGCFSFTCWNRTWIPQRSPAHERQSYSPLNTDPQRTWAVQWGQQCEQALATAPEHIVFHSKIQRLTSCVPQHPQMAPAAICQLGPAVEPEETQVSGSTYESTCPWNAICSSKLSAVPLLGTGHLMLQGCWAPAPSVAVERYLYKQP